MPQDPGPSSWETRPLVHPQPDWALLCTSMATMVALQWRPGCAFVITGGHTEHGLVAPLLSLPGRPDQPLWPRSFRGQCKRPLSSGPSEETRHPTAVPYPGHALQSLSLPDRPWQMTGVLCGGRGLCNCDHQLEEHEPHMKMLPCAATGTGRRCVASPQPDCCQKEGSGAGTECTAWADQRGQTAQTR